MSVIVEPTRPVARRIRPANEGIEPKDRIDKRSLGRARRRQLQRHQRNRWLGSVVRLLTTLWLMLGAFFPAIFYGYTTRQEVAAYPASHSRMAGYKTSGTAISAIQSSPTPSPELRGPTATPSPSPTATATPTPLPPRLVQATAWQATLDQAAAFSYATQTQAAGQYAATQTALPPILTVNALDRAATATAGAK